MINQANQQSDNFLTQALFAPRSHFIDQRLPSSRSRGLTAGLSAGSNDRSSVYNKYQNPADNPAVKPRGRDADRKGTSSYQKSLLKQQGTAIIVALFVVALVAVAATMMIERLRTDTRRTELVLNANKAYLYAQGSIIWAIDQLNNNWKQQQPNKIIDRTPISSPIDHQDGANISSVIYDAQGYFNINNLNNPPTLINFIRLIQTLAPEVNGGNAQNIALAVFDWISSNTKSPELDDYYLKSSPPYRAPHRLMVSVSELRLVKGITPQLFEKLSPYIIALPRQSLININNATAPIFVALSQNMTPETGKAIEKAVKQAPFNNTNDFLNFDPVKNSQIEADKITITSNFFLVKTNVTLGQQNLILYTLLERIAQGSQTKTVVLWQSKGTL